MNRKVVIISIIVTVVIGFLGVNTLFLNKPSNALTSYPVYVHSGRYQWAYYAVFLQEDEVKAYCVADSPGDTVFLDGGIYELRVYRWDNCRFMAQYQIFVDRNFTITLKD